MGRRVIGIGAQGATQRGVGGIQIVLHELRGGQSGLHLFIAGRLAHQHFKLSLCFGWLIGRQPTIPGDDAQLSLLFGRRTGLIELLFRASGDIGKFTTRLIDLALRREGVGLREVRSQANHTIRRVVVRLAPDGTPGLGTPVGGSSFGATRPDGDYNIRHSDGDGDDDQHQPQSHPLGFGFRHGQPGTARVANGSVETAGPIGVVGSIGLEMAAPIGLSEDA